MRSLFFPVVCAWNNSHKSMKQKDEQIYVKKKVLALLNSKSNQIQRIVIQMKFYQDRKIFSYSMLVVTFVTMENKKTHTKKERRGGMGGKSGRERENERQSEIDERIRIDV